MAQHLLGAGMLTRVSSFVVLAFGICAVACDGQEEDAQRGAGATAPPTISEGVFHLGKAGGVDPTINLELHRDHTFAWRTDPGPIGDWTPGGAGVWNQSDDVITLRPSASEPSMSFSPMLSAALSPSVFVVEANLRVVESRVLVTLSTKKDDGKAWTVPSTVDAQEITWKQGRACTTQGQSNGCRD